MKKNQFFSDHKIGKSNNLLFTPFVIQLILIGCFFSFTNFSSSINSSLGLHINKDTLMRKDTLVNGIVTFSSPNWGRGKRPDIVVDVQVRVHNIDGSFFDGFGEIRNYGIDAGGAVYVRLAFKAGDINKIIYENVNQIDINITTFLGDANDPPDEGWQFRREAYLQFADKKIISTGYNDPVITLITTNSNPFHTNVSIPKSKFLNIITLVPPFE